jgi:UDP-N-acetylglucosamine 3-dehydrogenase
MNVAVIGVGNMGQHHARVYAELPEVELIAVCDTSEKVGQAIAQKFHCTFVQDYKAIVEDKRIEAVSIVVPTPLHFHVASDAIRQGKHVLLEKPITPDVASAKRLLNLANTHHVTLLIGHIERFNPATIKAKELIDRGEIGEIIVLTATRIGGVPPQTSGTNIAVDLAIHDIDIINYMLGQTPQTVSIHSVRSDAIEFFLQYQKSSALIQANWITPVKLRKLRITGTLGYLELDYITQTIAYLKSNPTTLRDAASSFSEYLQHFSEPQRLVVPIEKKEPLKEEIRFFLDAIKRQTPLDARYALDALAIALKGRT